MVNYLEKFSKITSVFRKTIENLDLLMLDINLEYDSNNSEIEHLQKRNETLNKNKDMISKFYDKLTELYDTN